MLFFKCSYEYITLENKNKLNILLLQEEYVKNKKETLQKMGWKD